MEFLIKRTDGEWFDLHRNDYAKTLRPRTLPSEVVEGWGDHRIRVAGVEVSFAYELPGFQVAFEGDIDEATARQIVDEVLMNIAEVTGQKGEVL